VGLLANTSYTVLFNGVYSKIKSYDFVNMSQEEANSILFDYIRPACVKFKPCKQNLRDRDDILQTFNIELADETIEILINFMIIEYLDANYIRTPLALKANLSSTDFYKYDNKDVLGKVIEVRKMYDKENIQLMNNYSYVDSKLFNMTRK
jgi:hypothetical protein